MKYILLTLALLTGTNLLAQQVDPWTEYMTPSATHLVLKEYTGEFNMEITMWMAEGQAPQIANVTSTHKMILGDRFLEMTQAGKMMGMDYQSIATLGFNNTNKNLVLNTLTSFGTGMLFLEGSWTEENKVANLTGDMIDPSTKKKIFIRQQITLVNRDTLLIESFDKAANGQESKSIQYKFTRKK